MQSFCNICGAGPFGESGMAAHVRAAHPEMLRLPTLAPGPTPAVCPICGGPIPCLKHGR